MNLSWVKNLRLVNPSRSYAMATDSKFLVRNIVGSFLILVLSVLAIILLLFPRLLELYGQVFSSIGAPVTLLSGLLLVVLVLVLSLSWFIRSLAEHRTAKALNRRGIVTKGSLMDKWVEEENGQPVYYVRYGYAIQLNAMQKLDRETFEQLHRDETLYVLYLEDLPQVSLLDLD